MDLLKTRHSTTVLFKIIPVVFSICFLANFYYHYSLADKIWFVDLRNRVIGARLMDEGISPYYFKWNASFPETLYDPIDRCNIKNNMVTSPPSVLLLIEPLSRLSYIAIGRIWVAVHYLFFLLLFVGFYRYFKEQIPRAAISIAGILLLFSSPWVNSVVSGQTHFFLPAFIIAMILLSGTTWRYSSVMIGTLGALLVWLRPNALVLLPCLLLCQQVNRKQLVLSFIGVAVLLTGVTLLFHQVSYWKDFYASCQEYAKNNAANFRYIVCDEHAQIVEGKPLHSGINIFHFDIQYFIPVTLIKRITGISVSYSTLLLCTCIGYCSFLLICLKKQIRFFPEAILTGLFFYWLFELAAPITKTNYYYVELFVVVYYLAGKFNQLGKPGQAMLLLAMLLLFLDFVPLNLVIAEVLTMGSLVVHLVKPNSIHQVKSQQ